MGPVQICLVYGERHRQLRKVWGLLITSVIGGSLVFIVVVFISPCTVPEPVASVTSAPPLQRDAPHPGPYIQYPNASQIILPPTIGLIALNYVANSLATRIERPHPQRNIVYLSSQAPSLRERRVVESVGGEKRKGNGAGKRELRTPCWPYDGLPKGCIHGTKTSDTQAPFILLSANKRTKRFRRISYILYYLY